MDTVNSTLCVFAAVQFCFWQFQCHEKLTNPRRFNTHQWPTKIKTNETGHIQNSRETN